LELKQISYTYLNTLACSYQTFLKYEGKIKGPTTPPLALGNALHFSLENGFLQPIFSEKKFIDLFTEEFHRIIEDEDVFITYPELKKNEAEGIEIISRYWNDMERGKLTKAPLAVEKEFRLPIAGIDIVGKIDKIERLPDNTLAVTDYKSGKMKPDPWFLRRNLQFTAYYMAVYMIYGEYPSKIIWHHLRTGSLIETQRDEWDIKNLTRNIEAAIKLRADDTRYRIYNDRVCNYCPFSGNGGACDDKDLEARILANRG
jgi:hypothetical protein